MLFSVNAGNRLRRDAAALNSHAGAITQCKCVIQDVSRARCWQIDGAPTSCASELPDSGQTRAPAGSPARPSGGPLRSWRPLDSQRRTRRRRVWPSSIHPECALVSALDPTQAAPGLSAYSQKLRSLRLGCDRTTQKLATNSESRLPGLAGATDATNYRGATDIAAAGGEMHRLVHAQRPGSLLA